MGVILTHEHADAVLGIDELRLLQKRVFTNDPNIARNVSIDVFAADNVLDQCRKTFGYLFPKTFSAMR